MREKFEEANTSEESAVYLLFCCLLWRTCVPLTVSVVCLECLSLEERDELTESLEVCRMRVSALLLAANAIILE